MNIQGSTTKSLQVKNLELYAPIAPTGKIYVFSPNVVQLTEGEAFDLNENITSVNDAIDGDLGYIDHAPANSLKFYDFKYEGDINAVGSHEITVVAVDGSGNKSTQTFTFEVAEKPVYYPVRYGAPASPQGNDVVSIAYSLIGMPYMANSAGPYGFDCSGFVQWAIINGGFRDPGTGTDNLGKKYEGNSCKASNSNCVGQPGDLINDRNKHVILIVAVDTTSGKYMLAESGTKGVVVSSRNIHDFDSAYKVLKMDDFYSRSSLR